MTASPTSGAAPLTTDLEITGSDPNGLPLTYSLAFGDDSSSATGSLSGTADVSHTYVAAGSYDAVVNVSDGELSTTEAVSLFVAPSAPPQANPGDPQVVNVGDDVQFDRSGSQPAGGIETYAWDFGDGTTGNGEYADHTYSMAGAYTVTLTVTAGGQTNSSTTTVTVDPVQPQLGLAITITGGGSPLPGAEAMVIQGNGTQITAVANSSGVATLNGLPDGSYEIYAYQPVAICPVTSRPTVSAGVGTASIDLTGGPVYIGIRHVDACLTYAQILAAGIDPNDPANQNVFEFTIHLAFVASGGDYTATHL